MGFLDLFIAASMPVLKVLLITALGLYLALDRINIMGELTRKQLNEVVFFVFNPGLIGSNLARTINSDNILLLWFMPINILFTFIIGSVLGWILVKITRAPQHLKGLIVGCCAAGNLGYLPIIILPAVCKEKGSPFGAPDSCQSYGLAYASLTMAIGAVYLWSYVYNILRISSAKVDETNEESSNPVKSDLEKHKLIQDYNESLLLPSMARVSLWNKMKQYLATLASYLRPLLIPSTMGAVVGFLIGVVPFLRNLMIGATAPLRVIEDTASLLGDAAIPACTLIMGGNLLEGLKGSRVKLSLIVGVIVIRYIFLPIIGIVIVKGALRLGLVHADPLYLFTLLLHYALPPAMNIGTMTQLFGAGESECSVLMLWTYALASIALTLWCTLFMWLVS